MFAEFKQWLVGKLFTNDGTKLIKVKEVEPIPYVFENDEEHTDLWPVLPPEEYYVLGLLTEEAGEISQEVGKALRFGPDTKNPKDGTTPRERLSIECGDIKAAIDFAIDHGIIDEEDVNTQYTKKYRKLTDPVNSKDNLGRPLAPQPKLD